MGASTSILSMTPTVEPEFQINLQEHFIAAEAVRNERIKQKQELLNCVPSLLEASMSNGNQVDSTQNESLPVLNKEDRDMTLFVSELFDVYSFVLRPVDNFHEADDEVLDFPRFMLLIKKVLEVYRVEGKRLSESSIQDVIVTTEKSLSAKAPTAAGVVRKEEVDAFLAALFQNLSRSPLLLCAI